MLKYIAILNTGMLTAILVFSSLTSIPQIFFFPVRILKMSHQMMDVFINGKMVIIPKRHY
jgi:hypothetical protein